jgi:transposase
MNVVSSSRPATLDRGIHSASRKLNAVMRVWGGEDQATVAHDHHVRLATIATWQEQAKSGARDRLRNPAPDHLLQENRRLRAKMGDLAMENQVLRERCERPGVARP